MTKDDITPYQARLYNAVLFGEKHARIRANKVVRVVWISRRWWQNRALDSETELGAIKTRRDANRNARVKQAKLIRCLWDSRRHWQTRALDAERRLKLIEDLCLYEQARNRAVVVAMSSDEITYAIDPDFFAKPDGWDEKVAVVKRALRRSGPDDISV
ncbi:hypothetical protein [Nocardia otitidiscaviarum]|uniref:hypothetical protein n=1 Tax=Nocardia otitidiscaviarum TaxID=1823 RepID=UPI0004A70EB8|nr:hypothetical protein [Nocardia otitidiscaviarum]